MCAGGILGGGGGHTRRSKNERDKADCNGHSLAALEAQGMRMLCGISKATVKVLTKYSRETKLC